MAHCPLSAVVEKGSRIHDSLYMAPHAFSVDVVMGTLKQNIALRIEKRKKERRVYNGFDQAFYEC